LALCLSRSVYVACSSRAESQLLRLLLPNKRLKVAARVD